jgi:hypothetical protein
MVSTTSLLDVRRDLLGAQQPRILHVPDYVSSTGDEAVELAAMAGLDLDEWQQFVLHHSLGEREDGKWAAFEVGIEVPRQNGKGGLLEARELAGLFLLGEMLMIHSAHEFATAEEALERMDNILEANPDLSRRVRTLKRSHGQEGVYLKTGQRLRYRTRTKGGGRGWSADWLGMDEAMVIPETMHGALMPTLSARPNPQIWYTGSAVDQESMEHGIVFARVRDRAIRAEDPALAYFGWSPAYDRPADIPEQVAADPVTWAQANPALGIRITVEHIAREHRSMDPRTFAVERLGVGDWPNLDGTDSKGIGPETWQSLKDENSKPLDPVCFAFDVRPDRSKTAIGVSGVRGDGKYHVEVVDHRAGTGWVPDRLAELVASHGPIAVICDEGSPAAALLAKIGQAGVIVQTVNGRQYAQACGSFFDMCDQDMLRHLGTPELAAALKGASTRPLGDAWAWSRKGSEVDISPLVSCTLALRGSIDAGASSGGGFEW